MKIHTCLPFSAAILVIYCMFLCQSCNDVCSCKKVPCPGYSNPSFDAWFPYDSAQQIIYADNTGISSDTVIVNYVSVRTPYEANKGCLHGDAGCSSDKYISSNAFSISYYGTADWDAVVMDSSYSISVYNFSVQAKKLDNAGLGNVTLPAEWYSSITLNGKNYQDVQAVFTTDTANLKDAVYKIYIQKNTGLLAYEYYPSQTLYVKK